MCGILGYNGSFEKEALTKGLTRIAHRGPDGEGTFFYGKTGLGHRRLAIIDLSDKAAQPFTVDDRYTITYNGEIYNYLEVRKELTASGIVFRSESDTEVLLQAYIKWGGGFVNRLNGMWAFCIYDQMEDNFFFSRDRMGKKPLFYSLSETGIAFASEMKGLYPFLGNIRINQPVAAAAIKNNFAYESTADCLIQGISRFPAAHNGFYSRGKLRLERYWTPLETTIRVPHDYEEQKQLFRELFLDACRLRMRSDVSIGTALSGGLDSSAVICSMAHLHGKGVTEHLQRDWQHAFVASFPGTALDETSHAKAVTDHLGIPAHFITIDPLKDLDAIFHTTYLFEEIYYAPVIPFVQLYANIKSNGVTVSIDGHGADELFAGYPFDMDAALVDALPRLNEFRLVLEAINSSSGRPLGADQRNKLKYALLNRYPALRPLARNLNLIEKKKGLDFLNSTLFQSSFQTILPTLLRNYDRYSMINGVEIRMPFLDHRVVEFAFSIPGSSKVRNGFGKAIVRDALGDLMPKSITWRRDKIGFNAPVHSWMANELKTWIGDLIHSNDFNNSALIDRKQTFDSLSKAISKSEMSFVEGSKLFEQLGPVIWEKSLHYAN